MKIKIIKSSVDNIKFTSANETIVVDTSSYSGPEILLEDGSRILFSSMNAYFEVLKDTSLGNFEILQINIDELEKKYLVSQDDIVGVRYKNKEVTEARVYSLPGYRLLF